MGEVKIAIARIRLEFAQEITMHRRQRGVERTRPAETGGCSP
jgi:hypothetical protein